MIKIREQLLARMRTEDWPVSVSVGIVSCSDCPDVDTLLKEADELMYSVKRSGERHGPESRTRPRRGIAVVKRFIVVCAALPLCASGADPGILPVRIESAAGAAHHLQVEIATTPEARARGLMARDTLAPDAGMLFLYERSQPRSAGFWMYNTRIPLDIAFLDAEGRILVIRNMAPCLHVQKLRCPTYLPHVDYTAALEVNGGYFSARGIHPGDRVVFDPPDAARSGR